MSRFAVGASLVLLTAAPSLLPQATAGFPTNEQLRHFKAISNPRLAPDGKHILIQITESTADGGKSHLWLTGPDGEEPRQLTFSPDADKRGEFEGEWMPDGQSILFLAKRDEQVSLYRLPMNGGEARQFKLKVKPAVDLAKLPGALPLKDEEKKPEQPPSSDSPDHPKKTDGDSDEVAIDVARYRISPDGNNIAIVAEDPQTPGEKAQKEAKADADWVNHNPHGSRLYLLDVATGKLTPLPVEPDVREAFWSSDSSKLLAIAEGMNGAGDLGPARSSWLIRTAELTHPQKLAELPPSIELASWSSDGKSILYLAQAKQDTPPGYTDLYLYDTGSKTTRNLSDGFKGSLRDAPPLPLSDGGVVQLVELGFHGKVALYGPGAGEPLLLTLQPPNVSAVETNARRSGWLFLGSGGGSPEALLYTPDLKTAPTPVKIPPLGPAQMRSLAGKKVQWKNDRLTIEGRLYLPPQATTQKVPLIVEVHGGPLGAYSDGYEPWIDFLLGRGWAVLRTNPRGSTGYGASFAAANKNDLGGGDYRDIMAGVDEVLKTEPLDGDRMALMGYSYGGEMAAFVEGKTTRFKAIVSGAPVIDQHSEYGTEGSSWYDRWYFGKPWEHPEDAWRQSPLAAAGNAHTPLLLLQGEADTVDPLGQSMEMYRALRQMGVPVELVTYPRDNHGPLARAIFGEPVTEPWHGFDARRRIVAFIQKAFDQTN
ncbi:MAG TPA: S9 family peptidase [Acidobacteriaceae bacterium]|nr:S9 family peptidase [Acidobacteriaceae bacterium]